MKTYHLTSALTLLPANLFEVLQTEPIRGTFYEPPGHHGDHMRERRQRGLAWGHGQTSNETTKLQPSFA